MDGDGGGAAGMRATSWWKCLPCKEEMLCCAVQVFGQEAEVVIRYTSRLVIGTSSRISIPVTLCDE